MPTVGPWPKLVCGLATVSVTTKVGQSSAPGAGRDIGRVVMRCACSRRRALVIVVLFKWCF